MSVATRQNLHTLVDMVDDVGLETLYNVMIRFIPEVEPFDDEISSHKIAVEEYKKGDTVSHNEINWN